MEKSTKLYFEELGSGEPVVLVHGLFGSSTNWRGIARKLAPYFRVINVDMLNHGHSPHTSSMNYDDMSMALQDLANEIHSTAVNWIGHSMGGKAVMNLALTSPQYVNRLVVMDIAPVSYKHGHVDLIDAMLSLNLDTIRSRADADKTLSEIIKDSAVRLFLLKNLAHHNGKYAWRLNLATLRHFQSEIIGFPERVGSTFDGPTLLLTGERSNYVSSASRRTFVQYFPQARFEVIPDAGHWLHTDQPQAVSDVLCRFISSSPLPDKQGI